MSERCPECGALYALVGRNHRCRGLMINRPTVVANDGPVVHTVANVVANKPRSGDRHAKTDKRRTYMRELMRRKRASGNGGS